MTRWRFSACLTLGMLLAAWPGIATGNPGSEETTGRKLFGQYCSPCHGQMGRGDGELAYLLYPKPRDFTQRLFKLRSTPSGEVPTREDLRRTIVEGMPGTAMPSFAFLQDRKIDALVEEVRKLGGFEGASPHRVPVPRPLPFSDDLVSAGRRVFTDLGCAQCHGVSGKGDGPSAKSLRDNWGYPIPVRDFTRGTYVGGGEPENLYLRFVTGMDGTPMPSYLGMLQEMGKTEAERQRLTWGLVYYVKSLETEEARERHGVPPENGILSARKVSPRRSENYFTDSFNGDWSQAPLYAIPLSRLWQKDNDNRTVIMVRALYNRRYVAVMMEWADSTQDGEMVRVQDFQDAAAVQFSVKGEPGFHGMGSKEYPVAIWFWRSEWEIHRAQMASLHIERAYPNRASDADVGTYPAAINEQAYLPGRDAGNLLSRESISLSAENVSAAGPGTLETGPLRNQTVRATGAWDGTRWKVVFVRGLRSRGKEDIEFKPGGTFPVAFAVWNGSQGDRDGQKMVSTWYRLELK